MFDLFSGWFSTPPVQPTPRPVVTTSSDDDSPSSPEDSSWGLDGWASSPSIAGSQLPPGFCRLSNNCWANAFLSMVVAVPSLRQIYETVANRNAEVGPNLQKVLIAYDRACQTGEPVDKMVSQAFRMALNRLNSSISKSKHDQADAHEAFQTLTGAYEDVLKNTRQPLNSKLYCSLIKERHHHPRPVGVPVPGKGDPLGPNYVSTEQTDECDILLNLQGKKNYSINHLLSEHFSNTAVGPSEGGNYAVSDTHVQTFQLKQIKHRFCKAPEEFMLTLGRFGIKDSGSFKISDRVPIDRTLYLPAEVTPKGERVAYTLDSFIVHLGEDIESGHYVCYKKSGENWVEADDHRVRVVAESEIDQILKGNVNFSTSYMHHYALATPKTRAPAMPPAIVPPVLPAPATPQPAPAVPISFTPPSAVAAKPAVSITSTLKLSDVSQEPQKKILREIIWLHDGMRDILGYGSKHCSQEKLDQIKEPWLIGCRGMPLLEQLRRTQEHKANIKAEEEKQIKLGAFLQKLQEGSFENDDFEKDLTQQMRNDLRKLVYEAHKKKFGAAHVHKPEYNADYGRAALSKGDRRRTLLEAQAPDLVGENVVAQQALKHQNKKERLQAAYEKEQLEAFLDLLQNDALTKEQLIKAFERLEISELLRSEIYTDVWFSENKDGWSEAGETGKALIEKDPRCLSDILLLSIQSLAEKARK
jgi:hypothetical protein